MKVKIDRQEELLEFIPCMYQLKQNDLFSKSAVGITDTEILIYPDNRPNEIDGDVYVYHPVTKIALSDVVTLVVSKITKCSDLKKYIRLDIFAKSKDDCKILFINKKDAGKLKNFCKIAKQRKVKITKNVISYGWVSKSL